MDTETGLEFHDHAPEQKAGIASSGDHAVTHDEFMRTFQAFKEANDERLDEIARRGDVLAIER